MTPESYRSTKNKAHGAQEVGSLAAAEPAQENRTHVRLIGGEKQSPD